MTKSILSGLFLFLFSSSVLGSDSVVVKNYGHVSKHLTWQEAQSHCRCLPLPAVPIITRIFISPLLNQGFNSVLSSKQTNTAFNLL